MYCINYIIKNGDSLYRISRHFHVSLKAIMDANPLVNVYNLQVGETICLPVSVPQNNYTHYTTYLVRDEETLGRLLDKNSINLADLIEFNNLDEIYLLPGANLKIPTIKEGTATL